MLTADLIFTGGRLMTCDRDRPEASAMAVRGGRIVCVGSDAQAEALAGPDTRRVPLGGRIVVPGFIDAHVHLFWYGRQMLTQADLVGCADVDEVLARLGDLARRRARGWIQGHGFDQSKLAERRFPTRAELDRVSRDRPIVISRICGHAVVVNSAALAMLSEHQRAAGNAETGLYTENAINAFYAKAPPPDEQEMEEAILAACRVALASGITSVQTLLDTPDQMIGYSRLARAGKLPIRVTAIPPVSCAATLHAHGIRSGFGDDRLRFGAVKIFADGSLGAQTALLGEPYADRPETRGLRIYPPPELNRLCAEAQGMGFSLAVHAIGDQAVRESLDAIEFALDGADNLAHRHRIEHASVTPPDCLERLARRKIVVTAQPQFVTSDLWTPERLGPVRSRWAYPFRSMIEAGVPVALSSDCPVERLDAFACLSSAVGRAPWSLEEALTPRQAIEAYCMGGAYAGSVEDRVGSLSEGKWADLAVLSGELADAGQIAGLNAEAVYVGGVLAHGREMDGRGT